jgi:hypothetical protein
MKCPSCGYEEKYDAKVCSFCSAPLQPDEEEADEDHGKGPGLSPRSGEAMKKEEEAKQLLEKMWREKEAKEKATEERRRQRLKGHAITGALTFAILNILLGLPGSLHPLRLVVILFFSAVFGLPLGYLISLWGGGLMKGAVISSGVFVLLRIVLSVPALFQSSSPVMVLFYAVLGGVVAGAIPGAIIGWHVDLDRT